VFLAVGSISDNELTNESSKKNLRK